MTAPYWTDGQVSLYLGDALDVLRGMPGDSVNCCVTSPPYYNLRDYGIDGQIGLEPSPAAYVERLRAVFAEVRRVLANDGTLWLNIGDSYSGSWGNQSHADDRIDLHVNPRRAGKYPAGTHVGSIRPGEPPAKNLLMIPERVALALQDDGWTIRNKGVWHKPNAMPESVQDRLSCRWEPFYLLTKSKAYWFDLDAVREPHTMEQRRRTVRYNYDPPSAQPEHRGLHVTREDVAADGHPLGRNPGDVWVIPTQPFTDAHFAVFPLAFPLRCIKAGCKPDGTVLDPFSGAGTTGEACRRLGRRFTGIDLNPAYLDLAIKRYAQGTIDADLFGGAA